MKSLFLTTLLILSTIAHGQSKMDYRGFKSVEGDLIYQFIVEDSIGVIEAKESLKAINSVRSVEVSENAVFAEFSNYKVDYRKQGRKWADTPVLFNNYVVRGKVKIEIKPDRYRVTLYALEEVGNNPSLISSTESFYSGYCKGKDGTIRQGEGILDILTIYSKAFEDTFTLKRSSGTDDW